MIAAWRVSLHGEPLERAAELRRSRRTQEGARGAVAVAHCGQRLRQLALLPRSSPPLHNTLQHCIPSRITIECTQQLSSLLASHELQTSRRHGVSPIQAPSYPEFLALYSHEHRQTDYALRAPEHRCCV